MFVIFCNVLLLVPDATLPVCPLSLDGQRYPAIGRYKSEQKSFSEIRCCMPPGAASSLALVLPPHCMPPCTSAPSSLRGQLHWYWP